MASIPPIPPESRSDEDGVLVLSSFTGAGADLGATDKPVLLRSDGTGNSTRSDNAARRAALSNAIAAQCGSREQYLFLGSERDRHRLKAAMPGLYESAAGVMAERGWLDRLLSNQTPQYREVPNAGLAGGCRPTQATSDLRALLSALLPLAIRNHEGLQRERESRRAGIVLRMPPTDGPPRPLCRKCALQAVRSRFSKLAIRSQAQHVNPLAHRKLPQQDDAAIRESHRITIGERLVRVGKKSSIPSLQIRITTSQSLVNSDHRSDGYRSRRRLSPVKSWDRPSNRPTHHSADPLEQRRTSGIEIWVTPSEA